MLFENSNDFISTLNTLGLDVSNFIGNAYGQKPESNNYGYNYEYYHGSREQDKFYSSEEGFLKGNLYKNEYKPYKNMTYLPLKAKNEKEELMLKLYEYSFAITDLSFHLDLHADDQSAFQLFKNYVEKYEQAKREYERLYGPLFVTDSVGQVYDWVDNPWPWDQDRGSMYV